MELIFVTGNENKFNEAKDYLSDVSLSMVKLNLAEIQGPVEEVAVHKAREAFSQLKKPCFVEDTSLEFHAWEGLPGPYIKEFLDRIGPDNVPAILKENRKAKAMCVIAYAKSQEDIEFLIGEVDGEIALESTGFGWGFDRFFIADGAGKRNAELSVEEKNKVSHRGRALKKFKEYLEKNN